MQLSNKAFCYGLKVQNGRIKTKEDKLVRISWKMYSSFNVLKYLPMFTKNVSEDSIRKMPLIGVTKECIQRMYLKNVAEGWRET